jgi:hypothetical protein
MERIQSPRTEDGKGNQKFEGQLRRLKAALEVSEDQEVAKALGMQKAAFSLRKMRGTFPSDKLLALAHLRPDLQLDVSYIINGVHTRHGASCAVQILANGNTAARVLPADIEADIASEYYFTAAQGVIGAHMATLPAAEILGSKHELTLLTFCVLLLQNGTKVVGINYGAIDPAQHDAERGKQEARADAVRQVWPLLGYALRSELAKAAAAGGLVPETES